MDEPDNKNRINEKFKQCKHKPTNLVSRDFITALQCIDNTIVAGKSADDQHEPIHSKAVSYF